MTEGLDVVVIGGGPAGLSCALACATRGLQTALVEASGLGGQLLNMAAATLPGTAEPVPGYDFAANLTDQVMDNGVTVHFGVVDRATTDGAVWRTFGPLSDPLVSGAVVIATGSEPRPLGVPGESSLTGRGVSTCASCDGPLFAGQSVAVVGSGEIAIHEARELAALGCTVSLVIPDPDELGERMRTSLLAGAGIAQVLVSARVLGLEGEDRVTGLRFTDADGREGTLPVGGIFLADRRPAAAPIEDSSVIAADGRVVVDARLRTPASNAYAIGDVRAYSPGYLLAAMADGELAAAQIHRSLA